MESLQNLLIKYKRKSDETTTHTVMPNKNSNTILKFGHSLHVKNEEKIANLPVRGIISCLISGKYNF